MKWIQRLFFKGTLVLLLLTGLDATAQSGETVHAVAKGETLSGIARKYHTTVGDIMRLNGMGTKSVLRIGAKIKIPSKSASQETVAQRKTPAPKRSAAVTVTEEVPVQNNPVPAVTTTTGTHIVGKKETLYGIGRKYKVTVDQIKNWNHLTNNNIHEGQRLVINGMSISDVASVQPEVVENTPAVTGKAKTSAPVAENNSSSAVVTTPAAAPATTHSYSYNEPTAAKQETPVSNGNTNEAGYFASSYQNGQQELKGDAATFKTSSGWLDKKYYVLVNNIDAGTIVKLTANNKEIYAKVLGALPDIKEDNGLLLRLSNSAASTLGLSDSKFPVTVNY